MKCRARCSNACAIQLEESVIVTGGGARLAAVTVYSQRGFVEDLPQLGTGRQWHACGHFVNSEDQPVSGDTDQCWRV